MNETAPKPVLDSAAKAEILAVSEIFILSHGSAYNYPAVASAIAEYEQVCNKYNAWPVMEGIQQEIGQVWVASTDSEVVKDHSHTDMPFYLRNSILMYSWLYVSESELLPGDLETIQATKAAHPEFFARLEAWNAMHAGFAHTRMAKLIDPAAPGFTEHVGRSQKLLLLPNEMQHDSILVADYIVTTLSPLMGEPDFREQALAVGNYIPRELVMNHLQKFLYQD